MNPKLISPYSSVISKLSSLFRQDNCFDNTEKTAEELLRGPTMSHNISFQHSVHVGDTGQRPFTTTFKRITLD
ncbi:hypothetical protein WUBG_00312 [Wuchereria bancrofti]|uniref:CRIB domain-containing protein n=1 Tax=Wuchereria bancrofti TaxID=6293 RepID=J9FN10_WUCBA|nr:hypothetical protein WUBG_00312 [Wuchereria bancrofti]